MVSLSLQAECWVEGLRHESHVLRRVSYNANDLDGGDGKQLEGQGQEQGHV